MNDNSQREKTAIQESGVPRFLRGLGSAIFMTTIGKVIAVSAIAAVSTVAGLAFTEVNDDELVIVTSFGKIIEGPLPPGIHWYMPYFNTIRRYPTTIQFLLVTDKSFESNKKFEEILFNEGVSATTSDQAPVDVVLEISYRIEKNEQTVRTFVADFGRLSTEKGTENIEKMIADATRIAARSVLSSLTLRNVETDIGPSGRKILEMAMGNAGDQRSGLRAHGIAITELGYRLRIADQIREARISASIRKQQEEARFATVRAKDAADQAEMDAALTLERKKIALGQLQRAAFEASPANLTLELRRLTIQKWNGSLPQTLLVAGSEGIVKELVGEAAMTSALEPVMPKAKANSRAAPAPPASSKQAAP